MTLKEYWTQVLRMYNYEFAWNGDVLTITRKEGTTAYTVWKDLQLHCTDFVVHTTKSEIKIYTY